MNILVYMKINEQHRLLYSYLVVSNQTIHKSLSIAIWYVTTADIMLHSAVNISVFPRWDSHRREPNALFRHPEGVVIY